MEIYLSFIGTSVFIGAIYWAWKSHSYRWSKLAAEYAGDPSVIAAPATASQHMQSIILLDGGLVYASYMGTVTVSAKTEGFVFKLLPPFSILHPPLYLPFADLAVEQTDWYLNAKSFEIKAAKVPKIQIVITDDLFDWMAAAAPQWQVDTRRRW